MTDVEQLITDNLDVWGSAIKKRGSQGRGSSKKIELYGIKKLRELILELAVRGLLVQKDSNDEPASNFFSEFYEYKKQLADRKIIKLKKRKKDVEFDTSLFPDHWEIFKWNDISHWITYGFTRPMAHHEAGIPIITGKNVNHSVINLNNAHFADEESFNALSEKDRPKSGDILITKDGSIGRTAIVGEHGKFCINQSVAVIWLKKLPSNRRFLKLVIDAPVSQERIAAHSKGQAIKHLSITDFGNMVCPMPPLKEQDRIVAKVDELMALCDQLEQQQENSISAHQTLVETLLAALTNAGEKGEFNQAWARIAEHFDTLFTTERSIDQLKQTILQLAVMGKLVPQDPNDEPASVLLEKIAAEKAQLIKDKKIKKHPAVEPIGDIAVIPSTWEQIVIQDFADIRLGSTPSRAEAEYWNGDIPWVSSGEVANGFINDTSEKITKAGFDNSSVSIIPARSLLMAIIGQGKTRGQSALLGIDACTNQNVAAFVFNEKYVVPEFVWLWAKSKYESHRGDGHGGAQPALNGKKVRSFRFQLPPTSEQHRIVDRVDELVSLCDNLKTRINESQTTQLHLADAMAEQAIG